MRFLSIVALVGLVSAASANLGERDTCDPGEGRQSATSGKCITCPANTFGRGGSAMCAECPAGSSSGSGASYCSCAPGYSRLGGTTTTVPCTACTAGTSSSAGAWTCTPCPANTFSVSAGQCTQCPAGTSSASNSSQCTTTSCPAGKYATGNTCSTCPPGTYSSTGATSCTACSPGQISNPGSSSCTPCPGGSIPTPAGNACQKCPADTFSNGNQCTRCVGNTAGSSSCGPQASRRAVTQSAFDVCLAAPGFMMCAVPGSKGKECVNVLENLESCGGCVSMDSQEGESVDGKDCSAIPHVDQVKCEQGRCKVDSCRAGYVANEGVCEPVHHAKTMRAHRSLF